MPASIVATDARRTLRGDELGNRVVVHVERVQVAVAMQRSREREHAATGGRRVSRVRGGVKLPAPVVIHRPIAAPMYPL